MGCISPFQTVNTTFLDALNTLFKGAGIYTFIKIFMLAWLLKTFSYNGNVIPIQNDRKI